MKTLSNVRELYNQSRALFHQPCLRLRLWIVIAIFTGMINWAAAQPPKGGSSGGQPPAATQTSGANQPAGTGGGAGSGLQGISFVQDSWDPALTRVPTPVELGIKKDKDIIVLCYTLTVGKSATQPFVLESAKSINGGSKCADLTPSQPLLMNQILVVAIDMRSIPDNTLERFKILNVNITNQQGAPLNPTPVRPGIAASTATGPEVGYDLVQGKKPRQKFYYLTWPNPMPGDTIPTVSVNLVYTPVAPALPWKAGTFYPAGSIVIPDSKPYINGHYYLALKSGISNHAPPPPLPRLDLTERPFQ